MSGPRAHCSWRPRSRNGSALRRTTRPAFWSGPEAVEGRADDLALEQGSNLANDFVAGLRGYLQSVRKEMDDQHNAVAGDVVRLSVAVAGLKSACVEATRKRFGKGRAVGRVLEAYHAALNGLAKAHVEEARTQQAMSLCTNLDVVLGELQAGLEGRPASLGDLETKADAELQAAKAATVKASKHFETLVTPDLGDLQLPTPSASDFYTWLRSKAVETVVAFWKKPCADAYSCLWGYASERRVTEPIRDLSLAAVVGTMTDEKRVQLISLVNATAQPLLSVKTGDTSVVGNAASEESIIAAHPDVLHAFANRGCTHFFQTESLPDLNTAYFCRCWGCVPAYALEEFNMLRSEYTEYTSKPKQWRLQWCLHLDKRWQDVLSDLDPPT